MPVVKVSQLPVFTDFDVNDLVPVSDLSAGNTKGYTIAQLTQAKIDLTQKGAVNGVATLDANGTVPANQLPSYVDDVLEYATKALLPGTGETGKIYIVVADETSGGDTSSYRWTGSVYAMVSNTLTATDILNLIKTVDSTGSGLDADLLDTQSGAYYLDLTNATGTLNVLKGGTGTTTSTGTGSVVLHTSPVFVTPNIGVATGTSFNSITALSSITPIVNGTATVGTSTTVARGDHIHPTDTSKLSLTGGIMTGAITMIAGTKVTVPADNIVVSSGNLFTKTITAITTLTASGWLASGNVNSFILELTNGGAFATTFFTGTKWAGGVVPTLTVAGTDILEFYSHDGGTTIRGRVLALDSK